MKNILTTIILAGVIAWAGCAVAMSVEFDAEEGSSSFAEVHELFGFGTGLTATLSELENFNLNNSESHKFDFFTLESASDFYLGIYTINARLSFEADDQPIDFENTGYGLWLSVAGYFSGGILHWGNPVQEFHLPDGNVLQVELEGGVEIVKGSTQTISATVTNLGGAAPVPEPSTILLFGAGALGLFGYSRRRSSKKA